MKERQMDGGRLKLSENCEKGCYEKEKQTMGIIFSGKI